MTLFGQSTAINYCCYFSIIVFISSSPLFQQRIFKVSFRQLPSLYIKADPQLRHDRKTCLLKGALPTGKDQVIFPALASLGLKVSGNRFTLLPKEIEISFRTSRQDPNYHVTAYR